MAIHEYRPAAEMKKDLESQVQVNIPPVFPQEGPAERQLRLFRTMGPERYYDHPASTVEAPSANKALQKQTAFEGGATRTQKLERYDLVPPEAITAIARRIGMGVPLHGENNWRSGGKDFIKATINHLYDHLGKLLIPSLRNADDDLSAVICNAAFLCWFRVNKADAYVDALAELYGTP